VEKERNMTEVNCASYGKWRSPLTSDLIVSATIGLSSPHFDGEDIYWLESRPLEGGRSVIVKYNSNGDHQDITPAPFNVRSRVHEYGGGAFLVQDGTVYFCNNADQRVYIQCLLGGLVASQWALHQCFGGNQLCFVMNSHIIGVVPATIANIVLVFLATKTPALSIKLRNLTKYIIIILTSQIILGIATFYLHLQVEPLTIAHHTMGALLFGILVAFTIYTRRDARANFMLKN